MNLTYKTDSYTTHQPLLIEVLKNTTGNILECGCGDGSTILIREFLTNNRKLYSIESNESWYNNYKYLQDDNHILYFNDATNEDTDETGQKWVTFFDNNLSDIQFDIVFIDQSPWTSRIYTLNYYKDKAKYIIIHGIDYYPSNNIFGTILSEEVISGKQKLTLDFSDIIEKSYLFYPPYEYYTCFTGIPTLLCSNLATTEEFDTMVSIIENSYSGYY
jgi:hypothetical protein